MRHFDGKHPQHWSFPDREQYEWIEITYEYGAGRISEGPYLTRLELVGQEVANFILDELELQRPRPFGENIP